MIQNDHMMTAESGNSALAMTQGRLTMLFNQTVWRANENRQILVLMKQGIWTRDAVPPCLLTARLFE